MAKLILALMIAVAAANDCSDSDTWYSKKAKKDCSWVENKPEKRCKVKTKNGDGVDAFAGCPEACGVCELECGEDSDVWYFKKDKKDCDWAGKNTKRCKKTDKDNYGKVKVPASVACPEACGTTTSCDGGDVLACGTYELDEAADAWVDGDTTTYGDIADWDVSCVTSMNYMFSDAAAFNADLGDWDVSKVTSMFNMFQYASAFNGDLSAWDVAKVTTMASMFALASNFNTALGDWDVSKVTYMQYMFYSAAAFNGPFDWCVLDSVTVLDMFTSSACGSAAACGLTVVSDLGDC